MLSVFSLSAAAATDGFEVRSTTVQSTDIDVDGDGKFSQGDKFIFADVLTVNGKEIGTAGGVCVATRVKSDKDYTNQCVVTYHLPKGQITAQALIDAEDYEKGEFKDAITGGTDAYKNAGGEILVELIDGGADLTFFIDDLG
ncbi:MAG: allene oxide cyclase barrel-like domain-containing protein [Egibacteraceae bacterium]